ncbi:uncharacterized protein LOC21399841 isoform X1 [Morus notabilis]|uniref:uncharacterized protein LOC21399841 isoform X1 n=1 Tax=Morus notabilis TaxID=981085 RepID=UPI000CED04AD|nr:uncharacterized protein LOC21399841 isoform X1 [Morus notabilis]
MAKGDDIVTRKKSKANRKKLNSQTQSSSSVSARVAALIAAKKRRKSGTRRKCQGMCFSVPTPDDPFNDRHGKKDLETKVTRKVRPYKKDEKAFSKEKKVPPCKPTLGKIDASVNDIDDKAKVASLKNEKISLKSINDVVLRTKTQFNGNEGVRDHQEQDFENSECPSKYLIMCLNEIENALRHDDTHTAEEDKPLFVSTWGIEFWKCYSAGKDILETSVSSTVEQISWIVCSAADTISRKEEEGLSYSSPFLLFLVPSQEKAVKVRSVCKPLKVHGIHTVSIHPGASIDHQIQGLKNCEPEFLISTPERLLELISLKAIDISGVSLLVVDGLDADRKQGYVDSIKAITQSLSENTRRLVFNDCFSPSCVPVLQDLLLGRAYKLSSMNDSLTGKKIYSAERKLAEVPKLTL